MFEFDPAKSVANAVKHGVSFVTAQAIWDDADLVSLGSVIYDGEARHILIGRIGARHWTAIVTYRGPYTRIISVRRARASETSAYDRCRIRPDVR